MHVNRLARKTAESLETFQPFGCKIRLLLAQQYWGQSIHRLVSGVYQIHFFCTSKRRRFLDGDCRRSQSSITKVRRLNNRDVLLCKFGGKCRAGLPVRWRPNGKTISLNAAVKSSRHSASDSESIKCAALKGIRSALAMWPLPDESLVVSIRPKDRAQSTVIWSLSQAVQRL